MNSNELLSSLITTSSILIAVGIPFVIYVKTDHNNQLEYARAESEKYYNKLNAFRYFIHLIFRTGAIKSIKSQREYEGNSHKNDGTYCLYIAFEYFDKKYQQDITNDNNIYRKFGYDEIRNYKMYSRDIYNYIINRHDTEIYPDRLKNISEDEKKRIINTISGIDLKYSSSELTISLVGLIADEMAENTLNILENLSKKYEQTLPPTIKILLISFTLSSLFGVILPLLFLQMSIFNLYCIPIVLSSIVIICFISILVITWKYILQKPD